MDLEPGAAAQEAAKGLVRRKWQQGRDLAVSWVTKEILAFLGAAVIVSGAAVASTLPVLAVVGCAIVVLAAIAFVIAARRLLHLERSRRRWAEVGALRERQRALKAEDALDVVALVLSGDRESSRDLHRVARPEVRQALRVLQAQVSEARTASRPQPATASSRRAAKPQPPDVAGMKARRAARASEWEAVEQEIQALADPTDTESREAARAARRAAQEADHAVRERRRRGQRATVAPGNEINLEVAFGLDGHRDVRRPDPKPTPEEIARESSRSAPSA